MRRLSRFSNPQQYICSVMVSNAGILHEVYLNSGISELPSRIIRIENVSGHAYPIDSLDKLKGAAILNIMQAPASAITSFKVYSLSDTEKTFISKDELKLIYDIHQPTIESLEKTLGICLR